MFQYHVKWYCGDNEFRDSYGLVGAQDYKEATERITRRYGDKEIITMTLESLNDMDYIIEYAEGVQNISDSFAEY